MENKKEIIDEFFKEIEKPINPKLLQEKDWNLMLVGSDQNSSNKIEVIYAWNPHNYRLIFDFSKENFNPEKPKNLPLISEPLGRYLNTTISYLPFKWRYTHNVRNYGSEHHYLNFLQCTIKVRKNTIEVADTSCKDDWFIIHAYSTHDVDLRIDQIMQEKESHCKEALNLFMKIHGGKSNLNIIKKHSENKIKGDEFIRKIPAWRTIHDTVMKKVYKENNIEIYGEASTKNYVKNHVVKEVTPEIAKEINSLGLIIDSRLEKLIEVTSSLSDNQSQLFKENRDVLLALQEQIKSHLALINEWRKETEERRKPFFIRWFDYFKRL